MKVLLTGITGNLGIEIAHSLEKRDVEIVPLVRNISSLEKLNLLADNAIETNLVEGFVNIDSSDIDCIVHSAGNVHFEKSGDSNSKMMRSVIKIAENLKVPIYYVSTAFLWRESGSAERFRNAYETDKAESERILQDSGIAHLIFRPSVLVGHSESGHIINWSGYYLLVAKFLEAVRFSGDSKIRFPRLTGTSNMVPADQAAEAISKTVISNTLGELIYVTNPEPPEAQWVLNETLKFFGVSNEFEFLDIEFSKYEKLDRTGAEEMLYLSGKHFSSYWSLPYNFPKSALDKNLITEDYLKKALHFFQSSNNSSAV
jgi:thioester reductase-like protein